MSKTVAQIFGRGPCEVFTSNKAVPVINPDPSLLYGLELEIEDVSQDMVVKGMRVTTDGSLRNNGLEFITQPMTYSNLLSVLSTFFTKNKLSERNYSERCSIHVHTNALDLTSEQVQNLVMLYQVFEGVLFNFIGNNRDKNIFCVPWKETNLSFRIIRDMQEDRWFRIGDWQKYTALNLIPLQTQGSVEWRHMEGNCDLKRIMTWCRLIGHIYRMARGNTQQQIQDLVMRLNTTSLYNDVLGVVFQDDSAELRRGDYMALLEDGVLNMKYSILKPVEDKKPVTIKVNGFGGTFAWQNTYDELAVNAMGPVPQERVTVDPNTAHEQFMRAVEQEHRRMREARAAQARPAPQVRGVRPDNQRIRGILDDLQTPAPQAEPREV